MSAGLSGIFAKAGESKATPRFRPKRKEAVIRKKLADEPILGWGLVSALVVAILGLLVAFGIPITPERSQAILGVVAALGPVVVGLATWWGARRKTWPSSRVFRVAEEGGKPFAVYIPETIEPAEAERVRGVFRAGVIAQGTPQGGAEGGTRPEGPRPSI
jgi:hypothetical protein